MCVTNRTEQKAMAKAEALKAIHVAEKQTNKKQDENMKSLALSLSLSHTLFFHAVTMLHSAKSV